MVTFPFFSTSAYPSKKGRGSLHHSIQKPETHLPVIWPINSLDGIYVIRPYLQKLDFCQGDQLDHTATAHGCPKWQRFPPQGLQISTEEQLSMFCFTETCGLQEEETERCSTLLPELLQKYRKGRHDTSAFLGASSCACVSLPACF